ncbi:MAG: hypothetical protein ACO3M1_10675, partial [Ilumatobacteraceae bacterium]
MSDMPPPPPPPPPVMPQHSGQESWSSDISGRAGFGARLGAYLLDFVLYGFVMAVPVVAGVLV